MTNSQSSLGVFDVGGDLTFNFYFFYFKFCLLVLLGLNPGWKDEPLCGTLFYLKNLSCFSECLNWKILGFFLWRGGILVLGGGWAGDG